MFTPQSFHSCSGDHIISYICEISNIHIRYVKYIVYYIYIKMAEPKILSLPIIQKRINILTLK